MSMFNKSSWVAALLLALVAPVAIAEVIAGRVVSVHDGDTITVLDGANRQHKIRLAQIDAPELRQDFGQASKQALSALVLVKDVQVEGGVNDRYGRTIGTVYLAGHDVNIEQVGSGMAWVYRQYAKEPAYFRAEDKARTAQSGLWSKPGALAPWEWRHRAKKNGAW